MGVPEVVEVQAAVLGPQMGQLGLGQARFYTRMKLLWTKVPDGPREPPGLVKMRS
jgi:hypothetical protein